MIIKWIIVLLCFGYSRVESTNYSYSPTWDSLDKRPLPQWYDDAKFGIFLHWGVYSVPGYGSEWFWRYWKDMKPNYMEFMEKTRSSGFTYQEFAPEFTAEFFDATHWADIIQKSNAKYVVLTSKHHEGFTMWPSSRSFSWNAVEVGPHRDILKELSTAVRKKDIRFGVYYSLFEWFNPIYLSDKKSKFSRRDYVEQKMHPELMELVNNYKPEVIWSDGDWEAEDSYFKSQEFLAWLYNDSPVKDTVVANDRWGKDIPCHHGDIYTCTDRYNPGTLQKHKWENCMTIDKSSWGFRKNADLADFKTVHELIKDLASTVSCGGNLLMNVGPTSSGVIAPIFQDRLEGIGRWLDVNGQAIFKTNPWIYQSDSHNGNVWYTSSPSKKPRDNQKVNVRTVYAIVLKWPENDRLVLGDLSQRLSKDKSTIFMLGNEGFPLKWIATDAGIAITFPNMATVISNEAWSLRITNVISKP